MKFKTGFTWHIVKYSGFLLLFVCSCRNADTATLTGKDESENKIFINLSDTKQTIRNFGASDAWTCQYIGKWPEAKRNQVADWLFSSELNEQGQPKGIGLSLWRFNVGAGSSAQENISDPWRRTECFLNPDGSYDWLRQGGQQWFLSAARARGVENFVAFANSPPVTMTKNGKAFSGQGDEANLSKDVYVRYAGFLADVLEHFQNKGLRFNYISPFNEPQWDWTGNGQEGSPYRNDEIFQITTLLDSVLENRQLQSLIQIAEAGKLNYLYEEADKPSRGNQINQFFKSQSEMFLGALPHVDKMISGHSYFTSSPVETLRNVRAEVANTITNATQPIEFWQSEYCILGGQEEVPAQGKDLGMDPALYVARVIHHDLTVASASAWHWWLAVSVYDYKDGLIYADKNTSDGNVEDSKILWALGNYSRFIRPGAIRVGVSSENFNADNPKGVMVSAFRHPQANQLTVVAINYSNTEVTTSLAVVDGHVQSFKAYLTGPAADEKLKPLSEVQSDGKITIPRRSVLTLVAELN